MNIDVSDIVDLIKVVDGDVDNIVSKLRDVSLPSKVRGDISNFKKAVSNFDKADVSIDVDVFFKKAKHVQIFSKAIVGNLTNYKKLNEKLAFHIESLVTHSEQLDFMIKNHPGDHQFLDIPENTENSQSKDGLSFSINNGEKYSREEDRVRKTFNEYEVKVEKLKEDLAQLEESYKLEINKINDIYDQALPEISKKKDEIDQLLGHASNHVIVGDFENSAALEKKTANLLRLSSLFVMGIIVIVVAILFYDTTMSNFDWKASVFRILLVTILVIPATYLAKESSKHRQIQYSHQQTSLDLKAISPYIASLPIEEQHKIKIEIAGKLFAANRNSEVEDTLYPLNIQELIVEAIKSNK